MGKGVSQECVEGDDAVSAHTSNTSGNAYHTREVHIILQEALSRIALGKPSGFTEVRRCKRPFKHAVASVILEYAISVGII
jgi:hypothetical protein